MNILPMAIAPLIAAVLYAPLAYYDYRYLKIPKRLFEATMLATFVASYLLYHSWQVLAIGGFMAVILLVALASLRAKFKIKFLAYADIVAIACLFPLLLGFIVPAILVAWLVWFVYRAGRPAKEWMPFLAAVYIGLFVTLLL